MGSLRDKTVSGVKWQVILQVAQKIVSVLTFAVLARILEPSVFGLFALAFVLIDGLSYFKTMGVTSALIHRKDCDDLVKSTAFYIVQVTGLGLLVLCFLIAPGAAVFFKNPDVAVVMQALGIVFIFNGFGKVPMALLNKAMRFKTIAIINITGGVTNSVLAVTFALISPTIWSLVLAYLIKTLLMDSLCWYVSGFRLKPMFSFKVAKEFFNYGKFVMGSAVVGYLTNNLNNIVVGRLLSTTAVGFLVLATNIAAFVNTHFTYLLLGVLFPVYSSIQEDRGRLRRAYLKIIKFLSLLTAPFCLLLVVLAPELVRCLYGEKWIEIIPLVRLTALIQMCAAFAGSTGSVYMACGKPKYGFNLGVFSVFVKIPLVIGMTLLWGLKGTILADLLANMIVLPISFYLVKRLVNYSILELCKGLVPGFMSGLIMVAAVFALKLAIPLELQESLPYYWFFRAAVLGLAGAVIYIASIFVLDKEAALEVKSTVLKRRTNAG